LTWVRGRLQEPESVAPLLDGADAVIHAGVFRPPAGTGHRGADSEVAHFAQVNVIGSLQLMEAAQRRGIERFVFISSGGVHDRILADRSLDETHPLWPLSHYGAYKAAVEKFVHSFGLPSLAEPGAAPTHKHLTRRPGWAICALRPVGIYGIRRPLAASKWHGVVREVRAEKPVQDPSGGKEVHAEDIARAVDLLLHADAQSIAGQSFNCCDLYVSAQEVARIAKKLCGSDSPVADTNRGPRHRIETGKLEALGMRFSGHPRLERYVQELLVAVEETANERL
jgi:nucleoside-diphosphate-sugar epimerase